MNKPVSVLVIGSPGPSRNSLVDALRQNERVIHVETAESFKDLAALEEKTGTDIVFIDPLEYSLEDVSACIFQLRVSSPDIVFVLFVDPDEVEARRSEFFLGERQRFLHYYRLDKTLPDSALPPNLEVALDLCQYDIEWQLSKHGIERLKLEVGRVTDVLTRDIAQKLLNELGLSLSRLRRRANATWTKEHERTVFLSYSFEESDYADGLMAFLREHRFTVITGEHTNTFISDAIRKRIEDSSLFLSLMTKKHELRDGTFLPSLWLIEEKAVAISAMKPLVLMVERGVAAIGGLQSDYQRIEFTEKQFARAALRAVHQLESYIGDNGRGG
jgi:hypothetical protein